MPEELIINNVYIKYDNKNGIFYQIKIIFNFSLLIPLFYLYYYFYLIICFLSPFCTAFVIFFIY